MAETTGNNGRFTKGNPGRPKGSKNKLTEAFWRDFVEVWEVSGKNALEHVAANDQSTFARIAAGLMPKETEVTMRRMSASELSDDELAAIATDRSDGAATATVDPTQLN